MKYENIEPKEWKTVKKEIERLNRCIDGDIDITEWYTKEEAERLYIRIFEDKRLSIEQKNRLYRIFKKKIYPCYK